MEDNSHHFTRVQLDNILNNIVDKTLGEIDSKNVFAKTVGKPKITGIAGNVIEISVLRFPSDNKQLQDIIVDGEEVEVKTTGIKFSEKKQNNYAKEPITVPSVSLPKIIDEEFDNSAFWH